MEKKVDKVKKQGIEIGSQAAEKSKVSEEIRQDNVLTLVISLCRVYFLLKTGSAQSVEMLTGPVAAPVICVVRPNSRRYMILNLSKDCIRFAS